MTLKRSNCVPLVLLGTIATLSACDGQQNAQQLQQEFYTTIEDCQQDWGADPKNCTSASSGSASGHAGGGYYGPRYYWDRSIGHPVAVSPSGETRVVRNSFVSRGAPSVAKSRSTISVSRGGFGGSAHASSSGG